MTVLSPLEASPARLRILVRQQSAGTARITVTGEIDLATTAELQAGLLHALVTGLPHRLEVDLGGVTFIDCGGLTVLIVVGQVAARTGCQLEITNPSPILRRMLETAGLVSILNPAHQNTSGPGRGNRHPEASP